MSFSSMPTGAKIGAGIGGLGAAGLLLYRILPPQMLYYVMIGTLVLGLLMGVLHWLLGKAKKRKAKPMEKSLKDNSAATPTDVSEPARRARLDDLRKNFDSGVEKFKAAGKNLYSLPWYVLVGESGSGKTEAIRHSQIPFPPGLQDQLQGVGGTINMNWWFTNHAIILDTAGRLMFEEVEPGATSEWREFLKLLRANRPNCPINGMLLCIPADSLIKDTAEQIERKGAKIAQQLDQIQRALGVRFPVFVMVTKCDLINGFREFFDDINDPQLSQQMIGWTNPAPLDDPFNPEVVNNHLQEVAQRLFRRRLGLLLDPVNTEDPSARRTDQVDALYAFPKELMAISPRLQHYLSMVFVAGEWSAKPLFLRGIYFTSSMREGSALDADLAEVLGVPVESLPEGKVWERDRAYFLRDLFMNKVFREKGLVTNATNAKGRQRRRKAVVLGAGFLSVLVLAAFTWWGFMGFRKSIGAEAEYWQAAAEGRYWEKNNHWRPIVVPTFGRSTEFNYADKASIEMPSGSMTRAKFHYDTMTLVQKDIAVPWVFKFAATFSRDLDASRRTAQRVLFESGVLRPLVDGTRWKINASPEGWSSEATGALAELIRLETEDAYDAPAGLIDANALADYVLYRAGDPNDPNGSTKYEDNYAKYKKDAAYYSEILAWTYGSGGGQDWPPKSLAPFSQPAMTTVDKGVNDFIAFWATGGGVDTSKALNAIAVLKGWLDKFGQAEKDLLAMDNRFMDAQHVPLKDKLALPDRLTDLQDLSNNWDTQYADVVADGGKIAPAVTAANVGVKRLEQVYDETINKQLEQARDPHMQLASAAAPPKKPKPAEEEALESNDTKARKMRLKATAAKVSNSLAALKAKYNQSRMRADLELLHPQYLLSVPIRDQALVARLGKDKLRLYELRMRMYGEAAKTLSKTERPIEMPGLKDAVDAVTVNVTDASRFVDKLAVQEVQGFRCVEASALAKFVAERMAKRRRIHTLLDSALKSAPKSAADVAAEVTKTVKAKGWPLIPQPEIRGTNFKAGQTFQARYHPRAAAATFDGWKTVGLNVQAPPAGEPVAVTPGGINPLDVIDREALRQLYQQRQAAYDDYFQQYQGYWVKDVLADLAYDANSANWRKVRGDIIALNVERTAESLAELGKVILDSLRKVEGSVPTKAQIEYGSAVKRVELGIKRMSNPVYLTGRKALLAKWGDLEENAEVARRKLLPLTPSQFRRDYMPFPDDADTDLSEKYWMELCKAALLHLAKEIKTYVGEDLKSLKQLTGAFPLEPPQDGGKELTAEQVTKAGTMLRRILGTAKQYRTDTIGGGARIGSPALAWLDAQLEILAQGGLDPQDRNFCERVAVLLAGLAPEGKAFTCVVKVPSSTEQTALNAKLSKELGRTVLNAHEIWRVLRGFQGTSQAFSTLTTQGALKKVNGGLAYPSDAAELRLYTVQSDPIEKPARKLSLPGSWAALRVIHNAHAEPQTDAAVATDVVGQARVTVAKSWKVAFLFKDTQDKDRGLWLIFEYEKPLPVAKDWPGSKSN